MVKTILASLTSAAVGAIAFQAQTESPISLVKTIFVNDRLHSQVAVIDRKQRAVTAQWQITTAKLNVALALDETGHRLFVGWRSGQIDVLRSGDVIDRRRSG